MAFGRDYSTVRLRFGNSSYRNFYSTGRRARSFCRIEKDHSRMKALIKFAPGSGNVEIREVDEPVCGSEQIKLEIGFCGVCGTDLHVLHDTFRNYPPVILGHEFAGTVVEVGKNVAGISEGDRGAVLGATAVTCGQCQYCKSGHFIF